MSYDESRTRWARAWVALWVVDCAALLTLLVLGVAPLTWVIAFGVLFLVPEMVGLARHRDALPPLTYVVRRYVPRWVPLSVTYAVGAWAAYSWLNDPATHHPLLVVVGIAALVGWLTNHWDVTYDER